MRSIRNTAIVVGSAVFLAVSLTACGSSGSSSAKSSGSSGGYGVNYAAGAGAYDDADYDYAPAAYEENNYAGTESVRRDSGGSSSGTDVTANRKLIRTVRISMKLPSDKELGGAVDELIATASSFGGYVTNNDMSYEAYYAGGNLTIQIPKGNVDAFIAAVKGQGRNITGITDSSRDVTDQYVDTEARIKVQETKVTNYQEYLEKAENISDTLEISDRLNDAIADLESNKARLNVMQKQVDYTEVTVNIACEHAVHKPSLGKVVSERLGEAGENFVEALLDGFEWFIVAVAHLIFALPILWVVIRVLLRAFGSKRGKKDPGKAPEKKSQWPGLNRKKQEPPAASQEEAKPEDNGTT